MRSNIFEKKKVFMIFHMLYGNDQTEFFEFLNDKGVKYRFLTKRDEFCGDVKKWFVGSCLFCEFDPNSIGVNEFFFIRSFISEVNNFFGIRFIGVILHNKFYSLSDVKNMSDFFFSKKDTYRANKYLCAVQCKMNADTSFFLTLKLDTIRMNYHFIKKNFFTYRRSCFY